MSNFNSVLFVPPWFSKKDIPLPRLQLPLREHFGKLPYMKLKKSSGDAVQEEAKPASGGAFLSARFRNPAEEVAAQSSGAGDKVGGICAILATVFLAVITFLLYANWDLIKSA